jgi:hypothetical protein
VFLIAGSIIWPQSAALIVYLIYGLFLVVELMTWHQINRLTSWSGKHPKVGHLNPFLIGLYEKHKD